MPEERAPGWYWVRAFRGAPWHPRRWYVARDGDAGGMDRPWDWRPFEVGEKP
jgi:hypothetical protein